MSRRMVGFLVAWLVAAAAFGVIGFVWGDTLALLKVRRYVDEVLITDPRQPAGIKLTTALMFAWPPIAALVTAFVHRWRRGEDPSVLAGLVYFAIPLVIIAAFDVLGWLMAPIGNTAELRPMLTITTFAPGAREAQISGFVAIVMWIYVGVRVPDRKRVP